MVAIAPNIIAAAQAAQHKTAVPASVSLVQFGVESGWGAKPVGWNEKPPVQTFNFFGIKKGAANVPAITIATHEVFHSQTVEIEAAFRVFASVEEAFLQHAMLFVSDHRYAAAFATLPDVTKFVDLMGPVYATAVGYAGILNNIIRADRLAQYDLAPPPAAPLAKAA